jgi:hypothetical protein
MEFVMLETYVEIYVLVYVRHECHYSLYVVQKTRIISYISVQ